MRKTLLAAAGCLALSAAVAQEAEVKLVAKVHNLIEGTALYDSLPGSFVHGVSYNGEYAVGYGTEYTKWSFIWSRATGKFELITGAYENSSIANGVSNDGLVVGAYNCDLKGNGGEGYLRPGIWRDGVWTPLQIEVEENELVSGQDPTVNGEACFISGDGAFITGYIYSPSFQRNFYDEDGTLLETRNIGLLRPAIWTWNEKKGTYQLEVKWRNTPTGDELQQGMWSHYGSSQDATVLAGVADHPTGCRSPSVWVGEPGKRATLTRIYGKEDIDVSSEESLPFYDGAMGSVSPNGKYAGGYWDPYGNGYEITGFVYDTETEELEEMPGWGMVTAALDDGTLFGSDGYMGGALIRTADKSYNGALQTYLEEKYGAFTGNLPGTILSVSGDGTVIGGWYPVADAIGALMFPSIVEIKPFEESDAVDALARYEHNILIIADEVVAPKAVKVELYSTQGALLATVDDSRISFAGMHGVVVAKATYADGQVQMKKVVAE